MSTTYEETKNCCISCERTEKHVALFVCKECKQKGKDKIFCSECRSALHTHHHEFESYVGGSATESTIPQQHQAGNINDNNTNRTNDNYSRKIKSAVLQCANTVKSISQLSTYPAISVQSTVGYFGGGMIYNMYNYSTYFGDDTLIGGVIGACTLVAFCALYNHKNAVEL